MNIPVRTVNPRLLDIDQGLLGREHGWSKVIFANPKVKDDTTLMHELQGSEKDSVIRKEMEIDLEQELSAWAPRRQPPKACGVKLQGWIKGEDGQFMACWPANTLHGVEFASAAQDGRLIFNQISWSKDQYVILHSSQEFIGHREGGIMYFYLFRAWQTKDNLKDTRCESQEGA